MSLSKQSAGDEFEAAEVETVSNASQLRLSADTHRVIKGRRWRVSDPALDESLRQNLVDELMDARRAVKRARDDTESGSTELELARGRVHDAKVALGERGPKWWEPQTVADVDLRVAALLRAVGRRLDSVDEQRARDLLCIASN